MVKLCSFEIGTHESEMNILERFHRFQFDYDAILDQKIESVLTDVFLAIEQRHRLLVHELNSSSRKLNCKRLFINRLDKPRAEFSMDLNRRADHALSGFTVRQLSSRIPVFLRVHRVAAGA